VAKQWSLGLTNVLITTTVGLVGVDSSTCDFVIVMGILFNVMSFVQGMLRIKPAQRSNKARVVVLSNGNVRREMAQENELAFQQLASENGPLTAGDRKLFDEFYSVEGLLSMMESNIVCRVAKLSEIMGSPRSGCGLCDVCKGDGDLFVRNALSNASLCNVVIEERQRGMIVREWMVHCYCLVCESSMCNGESCMAPNTCWTCGAIGHRARTPGICPLDCDQMKKDLHGKACYSCFDLGVVCRHSEKSCCPVQRRLRRLLFHSYHVETNRKDGSFNDFLRKVYETESSFWQWLTGSNIVKQRLSSKP